MRRIPEERFDTLVRVATEVFIERGYRRTQMSDVAEGVGVAKGTLYGYVESKEALFQLCVYTADHEGVIRKPDELPLPTPPMGSLGAALKQRLSEEAVPSALAEALERPRADDVRAELTAILGGLYDMLHRNRRATKLIDRCMDHPEIGAIWQRAGRETGRTALRRYLESRIDAGQLRRLENPRLVARITLETLTTWAVHIHWDRAPEPIDFDEAREVVVDFAMRPLLLDASGDA